MIKTRGRVGSRSSTAFYVYIVRCTDGSLYTGITSDVSRRLREHNSGRGSKYTRARLPVTLAFVERARDRSGALKRESQIKGFSRKSKLRLCEGKVQRFGLR